MSDGASLTLEQVQALVTRAPYHQWLGLKVTALHDDGIELTATWRAEWVVNLERRYIHGGVLAALVDLTADWAMLKKLGRPVPTIDLRVDYLRPGISEYFELQAEVMRLGSRVASTRMEFYGADGKLMSAGSAAYIIS